MAGLAAKLLDDSAPTAMDDVEEPDEIGGDALTADADRLDAEALLAAFDSHDVEGVAAVLGRLRAR